MAAVATICGVTTAGVVAGTVLAQMGTAAPPPQVKAQTFVAGTATDPTALQPTVRNRSPLDAAADAALLLADDLTAESGRATLRMLRAGKQAQFLNEGAVKAMARSQASLDAGDIEAAKEASAVAGLYVEAYEAQAAKWRELIAASERAIAIADAAVTRARELDRLASEQ